MVIPPVIVWAVVGVAIVVIVAVVDLVMGAEMLRRHQLMPFGAVVEG